MEGGVTTVVLVTVIPLSLPYSSSVAFLCHLLCTNTGVFTAEWSSILQVKVRSRPWKKSVSLGDPVMVKIGEGTVEMKL